MSGNYQKICSDCKQPFLAKWATTIRCDNCHSDRLTKRKKPVHKKKKCVNCGIVFESSHYNQKYCEECSQGRQKKRYRKEQEELRKENREWRKRNPKKVAEYKKRDREKHRNKRRKYKRVYDSISRQDPKVRLIHQVRSRIAIAIADRIKRGINVGGRGSMRFLGCSFNQFLIHIESQFVEGMSWDNYGKNGWHVDHIYPVGKANLEDPAEKKAVFNWENCRPVWAEENMRKNNNITQEAEELFERLVEKFSSLR